MKLNEIEEKWQKKWAESGIFNADPDTSKNKFLITIPYPYLNGNLHAGHTRTFTIGDAIARYMRMRGYNVLFPMAFHVTGTPIIGLAELIAGKDEQTFRVYREFHNVPEDVLPELTTPEKIVEYFSQEAERDMKSIGFSIDWRRKFTTMDPAYQKFIEWQFRQLKKKGLVVKGSHPVRYCPHDENPVEDHDILRGEEATIVEYTVIKFKNVEGVVFPCGTLRPETVFGVTNLWVNPDGKYALYEVDGERWILSHEAGEKIKYFGRTVRKIEEVNPNDLIGNYVKNPITDEEIPILPADFVETDNATGIVMSVPAHAPYDYIALKELKKNADKGIKALLENIEPVVLISLQGYSIPAKEIAEELGIKSQTEVNLLEKATKIVYRKEFHEGVLNEKTGRYAGMKVSKIKDRLHQDLISMGVGDIFYEFSEKPVVCRCGTECVVKVVRDQWFLNYSNPEWKDSVLEWLEEMDIIPEAYRIEFRNKVEWLKDKACARRKGLGTRLPWDPQWLIESLADSTIYMAFYTIAKYLNDGEISEENLNDAFFDFVFLGKGDIETVSKSSRLDKELIKKMRDEFEYWYPVDLRSSGKDLVANHLLFFLFHHIAIFPREKWPRAIAVNGFVSLEGQKMSKSKGPLLTMKKAIQDYGADATRLYILNKASHLQDVDWRRKEVENTVAHLLRIIRMAEKYFRMNGEEKSIDRWMKSRLNRRIKEINTSLEHIETREAVNLIYYGLFNDIRWYYRRGGRALLKNIIHIWARLMAPFTPHLAEEIFSWFDEGSVCLKEYPQWDENAIDDVVEAEEEYIIELVDDIREISQLLRKEQPEKVYIYVAPNWMREVVKMARNGENFRDVMNTVMQKEEFRKRGKAVSTLVKSVLDGKLNPVYSSISEMEVLEREIEFIRKETFSREVIVEPSESPSYDPENRSKRSLPGKPAIFVE